MPPVCRNRPAVACGLPPADTVRAAQIKERTCPSARPDAIPAASRCGVYAGGGAFCGKEHDAANLSKRKSSVRVLSAFMVVNATGASP